MWTTACIVILVGLLLYRKQINNALLPLTIYSSLALGYLTTDLLKAPSYIKWRGLSEPLVIGGGSFLDAIFRISLLGLVTSFLLMVTSKLLFMIINSFYPDLKSALALIKKTNKKKRGVEIAGDISTDGVVRARRRTSRVADKERTQKK